MTTSQIREVLAEVRIHGKVQSQNVVIFCPFAAVSGHKRNVDHRESLQIKNDTFHCFACHRKGSFRYMFIMMANELGIDTSNALMKYDEIDFGIPASERVSGLKDYEDHFEAADSGYSIFPNEWLRPYEGCVPKYALQRGLTLETAKAWRLGHDKEDRRLVFPVFNSEKNLVGAVGRTLGKSNMKYRNYWSRLHASQNCWQPVRISGEDYICEKHGIVYTEGDKMRFDLFVKDGFKVSRFLYGEHMITKEKKTAVIVEGPLDTVIVWQALQKTPFFPVGLFGSNISKYQAEKLVKYTDGTAISFLDDDEAGEEGNKRLKEVLGNRIRLRRATYPENFSEDKQDPGKLSPAKILYGVKHTTAL